MLNCACVYEFHKICIRGARRFYFVGVQLFRDNVQTHLGALLLGRGLLIGTLQYHQISNISRTLVGNKIIDHSDVVGASPVGAAPTTSSFST